MTSEQLVGFIGGTGPEGLGLGLRFALNGIKVVIGSRNIENAELAVSKIKSKIPDGCISFGLNKEVAEKCDPVFIAVPYQAQKSTLEELKAVLKNKNVISVVAPLKFEKGIAMAEEVPAGSAALEASEILGESAVASGFHNISARDLLDPDALIDSDVIVFSDNDECKSITMDLAKLLNGVRVIDGGGLINSRYTEDLTALLLNINKTYKAHSAIRITGIKV
ncbi:MAG: NADPH-dependent F420 reductase [Dehalococcoidia bacterium]|nr:NADPH-dependent F420 reductase [Dehalococcoidia bacterium]MQG16069.1 NADPH-dependent F420 reductase [SAR202 cluster bacterium]|tara:strand:+ start:180 stop:845 length:666 start_codon:yes stop_codon:yes gene_type:complete